MQTMVNKTNESCEKYVLYWIVTHFNSSNMKNAKQQLSFIW